MSGVEITLSGECEQCRRRRSEDTGFLVNGLIVIGILVSFATGIAVLGRESQRDADLRACRERGDMVREHTRALIRAVKENGHGCP